LSAGVEPNKEKIYKYAEEIDHNENIEFERFREESQDDFSRYEGG